MVHMLDVYQQSLLSFLDFLSTMKGRYHEATFREKRNTLDVLGVTVLVHPAEEEYSVVTHVETEKEWLSLIEICELMGINPKTLSSKVSKGELATCKRDESRRCTYVHRDELNRFLSTFVSRPRHLRDDIHGRVSINYSPIFQVSNHP
ncbi:MAG: helix-turn-helix domain-containing protein [Ktedonobacteraceae bacterium]